MSALTLLPLLRIADGVQANEDWSLSIAFYLDDGVTPIPLVGLSFTVTVGTVATLDTSGGQVVISGPSDNVLVIGALTAQTSTWPTGVYPLLLSVTDGVSTRSLFASSTLTVGSAQVASVALVVAPDSVSRSIASPLPAALAAAFQALQPSALATTLADLTGAEMSTLLQALFAALPVQTGASAPVAAGQAFVNTSGFVVIAQ